MSVIYFIFQQTMLFTIPLMIVALGGMFPSGAAWSTLPWRES